MDAITDPRILAIMSKLDKTVSVNQDRSTGKDKDGTGTEKPPRPPLNVEEFLKLEHLNDWPLPLTSEKFMGVDEERDLMGSQDAIMKELRDATPVDLKFLANLENRLEELEDRLNTYASRIVSTDVTCRKSDGSSEKPRPSLGRTFMTDIHESDAVKAHPSRKSKKKMDFKESLLETKKRGVECCAFPGFRTGELTELPGQLEAPQLLNRVTKAQDFNPGFRKFWKKVFQSEASVAIMQDTFWWIFIDQFQVHKTRQDQDRHFDRIADSFVALFTSIHPEIKDKFFQVYSSCLAQAVFAAFQESFPESDRLFQDDFKTRLLNITSEWITGIHPPPKEWQKWDIRRLQPKVHKMAEDNQTQAAKNLLDNSSLNKDVVYSLDVEEFKRTVARMGESRGVAAALTPHVPREGTALTKPAPPGLPGAGGTGLLAVAASAFTKGGVPGPPAGLLAVPTSTFTKTAPPGPPTGLLPPPAGGGLALSVSQQAECGIPKTAPFYSHEVGPGPELQRALFNLKGSSPLVAHYLRLRNLRGPQQPGRRVRRTEITKLHKPKSLTYRQVIKETLANSEALSKEYQRVCDMTNQEIAKIERQQLEMNRNISKLQKELMFCKNSMEVKLLSEHILDKRELDASMQVSKDKNRNDDD